MCNSYYTSSTPVLSWLNILFLRDTPSSAHPRYISQWFAFLYRGVAIRGLGRLALGSHPSYSKSISLLENSVWQHFDSWHFVWFRVLSWHYKQLVQARPSSISLNHLNNDAASNAYECPRRRAYLYHGARAWLHSLWCRPKAFTNQAYFTIKINLLQIVCIYNSVPTFNDLVHPFFFILWRRSSRRRRLILTASLLHPCGLSFYLGPR